MAAAANARHDANDPLRDFMARTILARGAGGEPANAQRHVAATAGRHRAASRERVDDGAACDAAAAPRARSAARALACLRRRLLLGCGARTLRGLARSSTPEQRVALGDPGCENLRRWQTVERQLDPAVGADREAAHRRVLRRRAELEPRILAGHEQERLAADTERAALEDSAGAGDALRDVRQRDRDLGEFFHERER